MFNRRKKIGINKNKELLNIFFEAESEWKNMRSFLENSIEPKAESHFYLQLLEARYIFLLKEVKKRNLNALNY